ncbi:MAG: hypothetical protein PVH19_10275 [Planctomycetia bacterium]
MSFIVLAATILCTSVGCRSIYGDNGPTDPAFPEDPTFDWVGTTRKKDKDIKLFGLSNKAKAIEEDLGGSL